MNQTIFAKIDRSMKIAQFLWAFVAILAIVLLVFSKNTVLLAVNGFLFGFSFCAIVTLGVLRRHSEVMRFTTTTYIDALGEATSIIRALAPGFGSSVINLPADNDITKH